MNNSYNPVERREGSKGGKEVGRKSANSQACSRPNNSTSRPHSAHSNRRADGLSANSANQSLRGAKPNPTAASVSVSVYEEQVSGAKILQFESTTLFCIAI